MLHSIVFKVDQPIELVLQLLQKEVVCQMQDHWFHDPKCQNQTAGTGIANEAMLMISNRHILLFTTELLFNEFNVHNNIL